MHVLATAILAAGLSIAALSDTAARDKEITLCWAAWDPANALVDRIGAAVQASAAGDRKAGDGI